MWPECDHLGEEVRTSCEIPLASRNIRNMRVLVWQVIMSLAEQAEGGERKRIIREALGPRERYLFKMTVGGGSGWEGFECVSIFRGGSPQRR